MRIISRTRQTPEVSEILNRTRRWVRETFLYMQPDRALDEHEPLIGGGIIDSVGVLELIEFLQQEFHCRVEEAEITEGNLGSLRAIAQFVHTKVSRNGGGSSPAGA